MAAQNECSGAFQSLMRLMDKPNKAIFKMMELTVDHAQILRVRFTHSSVQLLYTVDREIFIVKNISSVAYNDEN